jgi:hypothetical protein
MVILICLGISAKILIDPLFFYGIYVKFFRKIIRYFESILNVYSLLSHK